MAGRKAAGLLVLGTALVAGGLILGQDRASLAPTAEPVSIAKANTLPASTATAMPPSRMPDNANAHSTGVAAKADDLKRISGIGPKLEKVLNGMGVTTFADIAKWTDKDMLKIDATLGLDNRIVRDEWVRQAKALLEG